MIRREEQGSFLLIAQHDHALVSGQLAEVFGNETFALPQPLRDVVRGVSLHDCGWPLHDELPTINKDGLPLDVFETPREIALKVWTASAERAAAIDPYAGLLVSLHVLNLSVFASTLPQFNVESQPQRFAMVKFQQREIERQENLRMKLGLRTERSVHHKLPHDVTQKKEDQLTFNFRLLQAMDAISLAACCTKPPTAQTQDVMRQPGGAPIRLNLGRREKDVVVDPWPFGPGEIELMIPVCRIERKKFISEDDLRDATAKGSSEVLICRVLQKEV
jgi:hypothetical protein